MFKRVVYISFSLLWLTLTFYKPMGILENLGTLFSFKNGIYNLRSIDEQGKKLQFDAPDQYQLEIHLDELGIPHIYGKNEPSVAFGLGYMHARDRYFQMELMTRKVQGKLSEFVGVKGVESDRFWLPLEYEKKCEKLLQKLKSTEPDVYADMLAYGEGVQFYLDNEQRDFRAPEYKLTGENPREWKAHYTLLLSGYMSYMLSYDDNLMKRQQVVNEIPAELRELLYEHRADKEWSIIPDTVFGLQHDLTAQTPAIAAFRDGKITDLEKSLGSNNWAIGAGKSNSGNAILCNDTHLDLVLPSPWYEAHLSCPSFNTYGLTLPCGPYVVSGHNEQIAWGMTNAYWDENDQYELKLNPKDTNQYYFEGNWRKMETRTYPLQIKGVGEHPYTIQFTELGAVTRLPATVEGGDNKAYVKRWYPSETGNQSFVTFKRLTKAGNWDDFLDAMHHYSFPPQNFAYADTKGNAGILCAGKLPLREKGYIGGIQKGTHAYPVRFLPFAQQPKSFNPKRGFVSSANQYSAETEYYINYSFSEIYRIKRINEVLASKEKLSETDMEKLQGDNTDVSSRDLIALLSKYGEKSKAMQTYAPFMKWDGEIKSESGDGIFSAYLNYFILNKFDSLLMEAYPVEIRPRQSKTMAFLLNNPTFQFKNKKHDTKKLINQACERAVAQLHKDFGADLKTVKAGPARSFQIDHLLSLPGWGVTVPDAAGNMNTPNVHSGIHGASMRTVIEMDPKGIKSKMILTGGQSGRVNSKNYSDQLLAWKEVRYHEVQATKKATELKKIQSIILFR